MGSLNSMATSCRRLLEWATLDGRRLVLCLDDACRGINGPFAPLARIAARHVACLRLGRYGRRDVDERVEVLTACVRATVLKCVYAKLTGMGSLLLRKAPALALRRA